MLSEIWRLGRGSQNTLHLILLLWHQKLSEKGMEEKQRSGSWKEEWVMFQINLLAEDSQKMESLCGIQGQHSEEALTNWE